MQCQPNSFLLMNPGLGARKQIVRMAGMVAQPQKDVRDAVESREGSFFAYRRNGDSCESKWIANDVAHADTAATVLSGVFHFL